MNLNELMNIKKIEKTSGSRAAAINNNNNKNNITPHAYITI